MHLTSIHFLVVCSEVEGGLAPTYVLSALHG